MSVKDILGGSGIFICDNCRKSLNMDVSKEVFEKLKEEINNGTTSNKKCYICNQMKDIREGLDLPANMMADAFEKNIEKADELYDRYKKGIMTCPKCASRIEFNKKKINCNKCTAAINTKKYGKSIKMPMTRKIVFKQYIKFLRGKSNVPG